MDARGAARVTVRAGAEDVDPHLPPAAREAVVQGPPRPRVAQREVIHHTGGANRPRPDSNRRITDLQSVPLVHLGTRPPFFNSSGARAGRQVSSRLSPSLIAFRPVSTGRT